MLIIKPMLTISLQMAKASANKPSDNLVDILRQIQARKTIRPEDATKALQQYRKVKEHIKELKSEIELFKATKMEHDKQVYLSGLAFYVALKTNI